MTSAAPEARSIVPVPMSPVAPARSQDAISQQVSADPDVGLQRMCPQCGVIVPPESRYCRQCGYLCGRGAYVGTQRPITSAAMKAGSISQPAMSPPPPVSSIPYESVDWAPREWSIPSSRSQILDEVTSDRTREWESPPSEKRFPTGILLAIILLLVALPVLGFYIFSQNTSDGPPAPPPAPPVSTTLTISNVSFSSVTETGAVIVWNTNEPATTQVMVCDPAGICTWTPLEETLVTRHSVTLSELDPGTKYHLTLLSKDEGGDEDASERDLTTSADVDTTPPVISGLNASNITESSAAITWITDEPATSQVEYGISDAYGETTTLDEDLTTSHSVTISGLEPDTTYHFRVESKDASGNEVISQADQTFDTLPSTLVGSEVGSSAPGFTLQSLDGGEVSLSDFRGNSIVMINFWFVGCTYCEIEMPHIQAVSDTWSGDEELAVLTINRAQSASIAQNFIDGYGYTFQVLLDSVGGVNALYNVSGWPTTFFIDTEGVIQEKKIGAFQSQAEIESILDSL